MAKACTEVEALLKAADAVAKPVREDLPSAEMEVDAGLPAHPMAGAVKGKGHGASQSAAKVAEAAPPAEAEPSASQEAEKERMQKRFAEKKEADRLEAEEAKKAAEATVEQAKQQALLAKSLTTKPLDGQ